MKTLAGLVLFAIFAVAQPTINGPAAPLAPPSMDKVVASVDGHDVSYGQLLAMLAMAPPALQQEPQLALQNIFMMRYLAEEGDKLHLAEQSPLKEQIEFQRQNLVAEAMLNRQRETSMVPPAALEAYYKANPGKYQQAKVRGVHVAFKPGATGTGTSNEELARAAQEALAQVHAGTNRTEAQAKALAEEIAQKARSGADFGALVEQYSEDPMTKPEHGEFPLIKQNSAAFSEDFKKVVFALEKGQVSDPVRQVAGFYVVQMMEKSTQPLSEVGPDVLQVLKQEALSQWFQDLNKRFKPEIKDPAAFVRSGMMAPQQQPQK